MESDATASYGAVLAGAINDQTTRADILNYDSVYNTYLNRGLPPTPISNVGGQFA